MYQVPNQINKTQYLSLIDKCTRNYFILNRNFKIRSNMVKKFIKI